VSLLSPLCNHTAAEALPTRRSSDLITALTEEIRSLRQRRSNLPSHLVAVRDELADAASASPWELPFAGELMDVQDASWQGAVERLLQSFSMTILVPERLDRKSTRLNSSHVSISYAVFCLKKKRHIESAGGG